MGKNVPNKIIVHCSAFKGNNAQVWKINEWHRQRDFPVSELGYFVGYHYVIEKSGVVVKTRNHDEEGAHTIGENLSSLGICLAGDFDTEWPSDEQVEALRDLLGTLCGLYAIGAESIFPHRHFTNKTCYGARLSDTWAARVYLSGRLSLAEKLLQWVSSKIKSTTK